MSTKARGKTICLSCKGTGHVCCQTWAEARLRAGEDLSLSPLGLPEWPLLEAWELNFCPFCGERFKID